MLKQIKGLTQADLERLAGEWQNYEIAAESIQSGGGKAIEEVAGQLIVIDEHLAKGETVYARGHIASLLEYLFRSSVTYELALLLYESRYEIAGKPFQDSPVHSPEDAMIALCEKLNVTTEVQQ